MYYEVVVGTMITRQICEFQIVGHLLHLTIVMIVLVAVWSDGYLNQISHFLVGADDRYMVS